MLVDNDSFGKNILKIRKTSGLLRDSLELNSTGCNAYNLSENRASVWASVPV